ncbi:hypothetical protein LTLLF_204270 [Microtus ochrogaster]|uniref:Uncharacterized protein n=1 Tax=Microtus ochrogaster TaxID=79684 RepID=A0A8J6H1D5_MICOH|nr:hypothetical protein LTLLF_204270 [Microtus ochrogaster]
MQASCVPEEVFREVWRVLEETRQMEGQEFVAQVNDTRPRALAVAVNEALKEEEEVPSAHSAVAEKQLLVMM